MRFYLYYCWDCDIDIWLTLNSQDQKMPPGNAVCPGCFQLVEQDYTRKNVMPDVFDAYVEKDLVPGGVEFRTKRQRDEVMAANHATYDSNIYNRGPKRKPWERDLTFGKAQAMADGQRAEATHEPDLD